MLVTLPAANLLDKQDQVSSHRFVPCAREELRKLQRLVPRLKELGVTRVICSDLDGQSAAAVARRLNVSVEEWQCLRRFNAGKLHGVDRRKFQEVYAALQSPEVPVKGGDSRASFEKRMAAARERLATVPQHIVLIADAEVLEELAGAGSAVRYHLYEVALCHRKPSGTMVSVAAGNANN